MQRGLLVYWTLLFIVLVFLFSVYYYVDYHSHNLNPPSLNCHVKSSFTIKGKEPRALIGSYVLLTGESGNFSVLDLKSNNTIGLNSETLANLGSLGNVWGFVSFKGDIVVGLCKGTSISFVDLNKGKIIRELQGLYPSEDLCVSAFPFWAGENYYAYNNGSYLGITSVNRLLTGKPDKIVIFSLNSTETHGATKEYLNNVIVYRNIIYALYNSVSNREYLKAYNLTTHKLLYTKQLKVTGKTMYSGFIYQENSKPLLWILHSKNETMLSSQVVIYNITRKPSLVCNYSIKKAKGPLTILPLSNNFQDINDDGKPDMLFAVSPLQELGQGIKNTEIDIIWIEVTR